MHYWRADFVLERFHDSAFIREVSWISYEVVFETRAWGK